MWDSIIEKFPNLFGKKKIKEQSQEVISEPIQEIIPETIQPENILSENTLSPILPDKNIFFKPGATPKIYVYSIEEIYPGCLKIGFTQRDDVDVRINEQYNIDFPYGDKPYKKHLTNIAMTDNGTPFTDKDLHRWLKNNNYEQTATEWFRCTLDDVKAAIIAIKTGKKNSQIRSEDFKMRMEQEKAVNMTSQYFQTGNKFLWNAKMRFGKTFTSYQLALKMNWTKVLVVTFKPAVESAWKEDLNSHIDFENWQFIKTGEENEIDQSNPYVCFGSLQDLLGTNENNEIKGKNEWIHNTKWDCVIFDEYHFGAWRENTSELFVDDREEELSADSLKIQTNYYLYLSGTPFRAMASGEFKDDQIFNWTYPDEQREKMNWVGDNNPYQWLPQIKLMTYYLPKEIKEKIINSETNEFSLGVFFKAEGEGENAQFKNRDAILKWLDIISIGSNQNSIQDIFNAAKPKHFPFENEQLRRQLLHTLWFMPDVASCFAIANLLKDHSFFKNYKVIVAAGDAAGCGAKALPPVKDAINYKGENPLNTKTITLSCGKLTTGVTVAPWTGIFMLRNTNTPETYFQAAFRVQSPWEKGNKKECYIFDFAPDRALEQVKNYCDKMNPKGEVNPQESLQDFIKYLPILVYNNAEMQEINAEYILNQLIPSSLATRWDNSSLIRDNLNTINSDLISAINSVIGAKGVKKDNKIDINKSGLNKPGGSNGGNGNINEDIEEKDLSEKNLKKLKEQLQIIMAKIPLYLYLSNKKETTIYDILNSKEPELFQKIIGLSLNDFSQLVKLDIFDSNLLAYMIYSFSKLEEESENYF